MTIYKALGTTDESDTCEICGKVDLRRTVRLGILDADGNVEEVIYAGTTCAARKFGGKAADIKAAALAADQTLARARSWAADTAPIYGDAVETLTAVRTYVEHNAHAVTGPRGIDPFAQVASIRAELAAIASGTVIGTRFDR